MTISEVNSHLTRMPQNCPYLTDGTVTVKKVACEESPNCKKENRKPSMAWERKKAGGACSLCFDAAHP